MGKLLEKVKTLPKNVVGFRGQLNEKQLEEYTKVLEWLASQPEGSKPKIPEVLKVLHEEFGFAPSPVTLRRDIARTQVKPRRDIARTQVKPRD